MTAIVSVVASNEAAARVKVREAAAGADYDVLRKGNFSTFAYRKEGRHDHTDACADVEFEVTECYVMIAEIK